MTRCRIPEICEKNKINIVMYDAESKRILSRSNKQRGICMYVQKNHFCVIWKKNGKDA